MTKARRVIATVLAVLAGLLLIATGEFVCERNRRYPVFIGESFITKQQLLANYGSPDEEVVSAPGALQRTRSATAYDYTLVNARAKGDSVRVLVWRHRCLCRQDSVTAFIDAKDGRVLHLTASFPL
jgi:hypothetical protein